MSCIDPKMSFLTIASFSPSKSKIPCNQNSFKKKKFFCPALQGKQERAHGRKSALWLKNASFSLFLFFAKLGWRNKIPHAKESVLLPENLGRGGVGLRGYFEVDGLGDGHLDGHLDIFLLEYLDSN